MAMNEKVRGTDQIMDKLVMEDSNERSSAVLGQAFADESAACAHEVVVKGGRKRTYYETEDLNSPLSGNNKDLSMNKLTIAASDHFEKSIMESDSKPSSSTHQENNWLESARIELGEVREENERLKKNLSKMMKDHEALRMQFNQAIMKQEETKKSSEIETVPDELVSLSLGRFSSTTGFEKERKKNKSNCSQERKDEDEICNKRELPLALESKFVASESDTNEGTNSIEEVKEEADETTWPLKKPIQNGEDEVVQQNPLKKARVCVRAKCDTPTMNDGCQWRKYGQKIAKGNPCPRAYYRCTVAASCPVRKQVQRCADDMSILITTYEGTHNHPLPLSATAMASTTSAAASMLLSSSSSSTSRSNNAVIRTTPADLHTLNFHLSDHHSNSPLWPSPSHPTITLDLTSSAPTSSHFNRFSSSVLKFASSTLNFSSTPTQPNWGNGFFVHGKTTTNATTTLSSHPYIGRSPVENNIFHSYLQNKKTPVIPHQQESSTIAAATKAITADPSFQSALAAALSSVIGRGGGDFQVSSRGYCPPCAPSNLDKKTALQSGSNLMLLPTSFPLSSPKSNASSSPGDNKEHSS